LLHSQIVLAVYGNRNSVTSNLAFFSTHAEGLAMLGCTAFYRFLTY